MWEWIVVVILASILISMFTRINLIRVILFIIVGIINIPLTLIRTIYLIGVNGDVDLI